MSIRPNYIEIKWWTNLVGEFIHPILGKDN